MAGVATDCCVISTVLAAADAGVPVRVVTDACAGSGDDDHERALRVMSLYAPLVRADDDGRGAGRSMIARRLPDGAAARRVRRPAGPAGPPAGRTAPLLGGSPLRLMRLAPRARALLAGDRLVVRDATTAELAARLLDAGLAAPRPARRAPRPPTSPWSIPVRDRPGALARLLAALRADPATARPARWSWSTTARPSPVRGPAGARVLRHEAARGPAAARNAGLRAATTPSSSPSSTPTACRAPGWLGAAAPAPRRSAAGRGRAADRRAARTGRGLAGALRGARSARWTWARGPAPVRPLSAVSYVPSAALLARRAALGDGFDETMRVAEDVDLVWRLAAAGWRVRYEPAAEVAHDHPVRDGALAAPPGVLRHRRRAARRPARRARSRPLVLAPESALAWALALGGRPARARPRRPGVLAVDRRPAGPPAGPARRAAAAGVRRRAGRSAARRRRGGRWPAAVTRHHWPLALAAAAALPPGPARGVLAVAARRRASSPGGRTGARVGPVRFAAARRLEDLAYGAGLWWGAVRARRPRALLPARPPVISTEHTAARNDAAVAAALSPRVRAVPASVGARDIRRPGQDPP